MTDAEVVRTLAEFMGWTSIKAVECDPLAFSKSTTVQFVGCFGPTRGFQCVPEYLKDYNAVAGVWRRVQKTDPYVLLPAADRGIPYNWFDATPREHAYALAKAIAGAKK